MIMFIDGDAFPIAPIVPFLRRKARALPAGRGAARREQRRPPAPPLVLRHDARGSGASCPATGGAAHTWTNPQGKEVTDVGGNLLGLLEDARHRVVSDAAHEQGQPAPAPVRRLRGSRLPPRRRLPPHRGRQRLWRCRGRGQAQRDAARVAWRRGCRGRGLAAGSGSRSTPCAATARRSARSSREVNEQVFELIQRDDEFYRQLIDPERGGELATIKAPVLLEEPAPKLTVLSWSSFATR